MATAAKPAAGSDKISTLVITRSFDAPREAVFQAWVDPAQMARWIGPRSVKAEVETMEARQGGAYRIAMHGESGSIHIVGGVYREIVPPERLVFTWAWEDTAVKHVAGHEMLVTVTFRTVGRKTEMTLRHERFASKDSHDSHEHGWTGSFDKLADMLAGRPGMP